MKHYIFELKRFVMNRRNIVLGLILSSLFFFNFYIQVSVAKVTDSQLLMQQEISFVQQEIAQEQSGMKNYTAAEKPYERKTLQLVQQQLTALQNKDMNQYYALEFQKNQNMLEEAQGNSMSAFSMQVLESENAYIKLVQSRHLNFEIMPSIPLTSFGYYVAVILPMIYTSFIIFALSLFVSVDLAVYFEKKEDRYSHFIGVKGLRAIFPKMQASMSVTYVWFLVLSIISILFFGFINGYNSLNYPANLSNQWGPGSPAAMSNVPSNMAIPVGEVILISVLYFLLVLLFLASLGALLSILTRRSLIVVGMIAIVIIGWSLVCNLSYLQFLRPFIPMSYLNPVELLCNPSYLVGKQSLLVGTLYLLTISGLFIFSTNVLLKKYKIRRI